jgi:predicted metalloprotease with PDZ domain
VRTGIVAGLLTVFPLLGTQAAFAASAPAPRDVPYPGVLTLHVDATDLDHRLFRARETIPVVPGALTLYYPQWLPGQHAPRGAIDAFAGLKVSANGRRIDWVRDPTNVYAFQLQVPQGVQTLELEFQFVSPQTPEQGRITMTPEIVGVQWEQVLLYPAGHYANRIRISPSLSLPAEWGFGTALDVERREESRVQFRTVTLETLIDSPLFAGKYFTQVDLDPGAKEPVRLNVFADTPDELVIQPEQLEAHRKLVKEISLVFGRRYFDTYDFLFATSNNFGGIGLEHRRSSENAVRSGYFKSWDKTVTRRTLLPHEMTHAWNGKFVRPADLWTPNYNVPMQDSLLWVYEGQTQFWGQILSARSGLWSDTITKGSLAAIAANLEDRRQGRTWRPLQDTTHQPIITARRPLSWVSWQRTEDYYDEGLLLWLAVDSRIRELTGDRRSIDDFALAFFGNRANTEQPALYDFDDVVKALQGVAAFEWATWLRERLTSTDNQALLEGLVRSGWKLVYTETPSEFLQKADEVGENTSLSYSLGVVLDKDAKFTDVVWDSPAFKAGLTVSMTVIAVNGRAYTPTLLKEAITAAKTSKVPVELLVRSADRFRTIPIPYFDGHRFPSLERIEGTPDRLSALLRPRS